MNAATEVGSAPTSWIRLSEFSRFSIPPQRLKLCISPATACTNKSDLRGLWSVTARANWRIVFRFEGNDASDVELIDYH
jgi:hypothetical protein